MRSRSVALAVLLVAALSSLAGCGGASDKLSAAHAPAAHHVAPDEDLAPPREPGPPAPPSDMRLSTVSESRSYAGSDDEEAPTKTQASALPAPAPPAPRPTTPPASPPSGAPAQPQAAPPGAAVRSEEKADPTSRPAPARELVVYTARFTMAVHQVDQGLAAVEKIARDNGGFLARKKDREITIRVPRGRFEPTLAAVDQIGDVLQREVQAQDVTDEHVDLEIRIKNARAMQKRLTDLLARAGVKDALEIEKELHRVTEELELLEGRMKVLKDKIALSTITVVFEPRGAAIQTARVRLPFPWLGVLGLPSLLSLSEEK